MRLSLLLLAVFFTLPQAHAQTPEPDTDHDGLSDTLEQTLIDRFTPTFFIGRDDCSNLPAEFAPDLPTPTVARENGTIYAQAFPVANDPSRAEIHFYHLWRRDCGQHPHPLDTEHVAVLLQRSPAGDWHALYWYAGAHENTVCDVSQITRASTLHAEDRGPKVWISPGKHASYLAESLCNSGCGADRCTRMTALPAVPILNLGEPAHPMNGSVFIASPAWPLEAKMLHTNFPPAPVARLETLPDTDIAWFNPGRHPVQGIISRSSATEQVIAGGGQATTAALDTANRNTSIALDTAQTKTGNALTKSFHKTTHALGTATHDTVKALTPDGH